MPDSDPEPMTTDLPHPGEPPASSRWTVRYAVTALVVAVVLGIGEGLVVSLLVGAGPLRAGIAGILLDLTLLATLVPLHRRRPFRAGDLGLRAAPAAASVGWVLLAVIVVGVVNALYLRTLLHLSGRQTLGVGLHGSTVGLVVVGLFVCVSAPLTEEVFFRRGLLLSATARGTVRISPRTHRSPTSSRVRIDGDRP